MNEAPIPPTPTVERAGTQAPSSGSAEAAPRFAVLFRTHMWDAFIQRQFERLRAKMGKGDVFIVANNTHGTCNGIEGLPFVMFHERDIEAMGYARAGEGELLWYNVDYALYYFLQQKPDYDYYVLFEYDVVVNLELDELVAEVAARGTDLVGLTKGDPVETWWYTPTCSDIYSKSDIRKMLFPIGIFSRRAAEHLSRQKRRLSDLLREGKIANWPHCEAFITTEVSLAGYRIDEFSVYGSTGKLSFAPAYLEQDLGELGADSFIHPVLDTPRYVQNVLKYEHKPENFFFPISEFRQRLARVPLRDYIGPLSVALRKRLAEMPAIVTRRITLYSN